MIGGLLQQALALALMADVTLWESKRNLLLRMRHADFVTMQITSIVWMGS